MIVSVATSLATEETTHTARKQRGDRRREREEAPNQAQEGKHTRF